MSGFIYCRKYYEIKILFGLFILLKRFVKVIFDVFRDETMYNLVEKDSSTSEY